MAQALNEDGVQKLTALKGQLLSKGYQLSDPGLKEILRQGKYASVCLNCDQLTTLVLSFH